MGVAGTGVGTNKAAGDGTGVTSDGESPPHELTTSVDAVRHNLTDLPMFTKSPVT
jgi:hypothetical protein